MPPTDVWRRRRPLPSPGRAWTPSRPPGSPAGSSHSSARGTRRPKGPRADPHLAAYNSERNIEALRPLQQDLGFLDRFLSPNAQHANGMMWIGPAGTYTALHHDLTNNFIAQVVGRKRLKVLPASEVGRLYNDTHVFSDLPDLDSPIDGKRFPRLVGARIADIVLEPGEIIFMPLAWWHQVKSLDFSVTLTYTNFLWPNDASATYPGG